MRGPHTLAGGSSLTPGHTLAGPPPGDPGPSRGHAASGVSDNRYSKASTGNVQLSPSEEPLMLALNLRPLRSPVPAAHGVPQGRLPSPPEDTSQQPACSDGSRHPNVLTWPDPSQLPLPLCRKISRRRFLCFLLSCSPQTRASQTHASRPSPVPPHPQAPDLPYPLPSQG